LGRVIHFDSSNWAYSGCRACPGRWVCPTYIFHVEDESPWVGPDPQDFCGIFGPLNFFDGVFFDVNFFGPNPHGQGQTLWAGSN